MLQQNDGMVHTLRAITQLLQQQNPSEPPPIINRPQTPLLHQIQSKLPQRTIINFNYRDLKIPITSKLQQPIPQKPESIQFEKSATTVMSPKAMESKLESITKDIKLNDQESSGLLKSTISQEQISENFRMSKKMYVYSLSILFIYYSSKKANICPHLNKEHYAKVYKLTCRYKYLI